MCSYDVDNNPVSLTYYCICDSMFLCFFFLLAFYYPAWLISSPVILCSMFWLDALLSYFRDFTIIVVSTKTITMIKGKDRKKIMNKKQHRTFICCYCWWPWWCWFSLLSVCMIILFANKSRKWEEKKKRTNRNIRKHYCCNNNNDNARVIMKWRELFNWMKMRQSEIKTIVWMCAFPSFFFFFLLFLNVKCVAVSIRRRCTLKIMIIIFVLK